MNGAFYVGAVGLRAQERALDVLSNNIANLNTPSFKRSDVRFSSILADRVDPSAAPLPLTSIFAPAGVVSSSVAAVDESGDLETTGRSTDLAIAGRGFIELISNNGQTLLWRGGPLMVRDDGLLAAADSGLALKAAIAVPTDATSLVIGSDGLVKATTSSDRGSVEIGQINLVTADNANGFAALDGGLYQASEDTRLKDAQPGEDGAGSLVQGAIEHSNVEITSQMVQVLLVQRCYSANAQVVQAADQLMEIANGLRR